MQDRAGSRGFYVRSACRTFMPSIWSRVRMSVPYRFTRTHSSCLRTRSAAPHWAVRNHMAC